MADLSANPPRCTWHVERDGVVVAKGTGVYACYRDAAKVAKLVVRVERVCSDKPTRAPANEADTHEAGDATVRPGTRPGYVEVVFDSKPSAEVRSELKAAKFRWSRHNACWYGKETALPARYRKAA